MRKIFKKIISVSLFSVITISTLFGCNSGSEEETTPGVNVADMTPEEYYKTSEWASVEYEYAKEDHYRNYYEVFVYSFADSDGDGIGDFKGLTSKLDYIQDMGFNGIWLMPIMQSTTYHKYDVVNYMSIDSEYGTMEDFIDFIDACHERNINVIIDLVFNHTSSKHEWFTTAVDYYKSLGDDEEPDFEECPYANYYNFKKNDTVNNFNTHTKISGTKWCYESVFWSEMPDLNLDNEAVRAEIEKVVQYWINLGVDGFRLDAAKEYTSGSVVKNVEVLNWFETYVQSVEPDAYIVAEVWDSYDNIKKYYESGIESIFDYAFGNAGGNLIKDINTQKGKKLAKDIESCEAGYYEMNANMVNAPFLSNHDTGRISGFVSRNENKIKLAGAINQIMSGCSFVYYGEEIGMFGNNSKDENKRAPMPWSNFKGGETTVGPAAMDSGITHDFGNVESQLADKNSILWYYKNMLHIRRTYEEIAKGRTYAITDLEDSTICVLKKEYKDETMYILINLSEEDKTIDFSKSTYGYEEMVASLVTNIENEVKLDSEKLSLPAYGIAFLK